MFLHESVWQTENGVDRGFVKHWLLKLLALSLQELVPCAAAGGLFPVGEGGRRVLRLICAEPNYRPYLSHF